MRKAFARLNAVSSIYSKKIEALTSAYRENTNDKSCFDFYSFSGLNDSLALLSKAQIGGQGSELAGAISSIKESNNQAITLSCAAIY